MHQDPLLVVVIEGTSSNSTDDIYNHNNRPVIVVIDGTSSNSADDIYNPNDRPFIVVIDGTSSNIYRYGFRMQFLDSDQFHIYEEVFQF